MRTVSVDLGEILDVVSAARMYGYEDEVLFHAFGQWTGPVTDDEIRENVDWFLTPEARSQGYSEEDRGESLRALTGWRDKYATKAPGA